MVKLLKYLRPFAPAIAGVLVLVLFQTLAELYLPTLMSDIVNIGIVKGDTRYILRVGVWMLLVAAGAGACAVAASYLSARVAVGFGKDLRSRVFTRVQSYSLGEFDRMGTATLITRTTNDIMQIQHVIIMMQRMVVGAPIMMMGGIIMALSKHPTLSLVLVAAVPVLVATILLIAAKAVPLFRALQKKLDRLNLVVRENLTGIRVIRAFDRIDYEKKRFYEANLDLTWTAIRVHRIIALLMPSLMLMMNLTSIAIVWFGGIRIEKGLMQVGDMMAFLQYAMYIMFSLVALSVAFVMLPRAEASAARINEVLDTVPEINDPPEVEPEVTYRGVVEFEDVSFSYPGAEQPALSHISFRTRPGQVTAIVGGTGSGKSTLVSLILRFYDVDSGRVTVDGVDVRKMTQESLRARIGFVPQQSVLFSGTVAENIRYGKETASDDEVRRAAEIAQALEFVSGLEGEFNAVIAQGGTNLSGGQKQRLAIARALVRRPEIYVLDDSFSALDFKTDAKLRAALREEMSDATVLIVTQRVSTVMDADQIVVLDGGRVAGIGTHRELLKKCPVYREMVFSQLSEEELA